MQVLVRTLDFHELDELRKAFKMLDTGNTGTLTFTELEAALVQAGLNVASKQI
jgi:Ca2+-binding EF-hand superfamily protein